MIAFILQKIPRRQNKYKYLLCLTLILFIFSFNLQCKEKEKNEKDAGREGYNSVSISPNNSLDVTRFIRKNFVTGKSYSVKDNLKIFKKILVDITWEGSWDIVNIGNAYGTINFLKDGSFIRRFHYYEDNREIHIKNKGRWRLIGNVLQCKFETSNKWESNKILKYKLIGNHFSDIYKDGMWYTFDIVFDVYSEEYKKRTLLLDNDFISLRLTFQFYNKKKR